MSAISYQEAFNLAMLLVAAMGGWGMKMLYDAIKSLKQADKELGEKVQNLELSIAGSIATKEDTEKILGKIDVLSARVTDLYIAHKTHVAASVANGIVPGTAND